MTLGLHHARGFADRAGLIDTLQGDIGEALADGQFVLRVDVLLFAEVDVHGLHRSGDIISDPFHRFTETRPGGINLHGEFRLAGHVTRQLDDDERECFAPGLVPGLDHGPQHPLVGLRLAGVGFALIPDDAAETVADPRVDHAVPVHVRAIAPDRTELAGVLLELREDLRVLLDGDAGLQLLKILGAGHDARGLLGVEVLGVRDVGIHALRTPGLGARTADGRDDETDGLLEIGPEFATEIESGGGEARHGLRIGQHPRAALDILDGLGGGNPPDSEHADAGVGRTAHRILQRMRRIDGPVHVGLTGTDPDFADDDILRHELLVARVDDEIGTLLGGLETLERGAEDTIGACDSLGLGFAERDGHLGAGSGLAIDGGLTGLEHGVVGEETVQLELSGRNERGAAKHEECEAG